MKINGDGFARVALIPILILLGAVVLTAFLLTRQTRLINRAAPTTLPSASPWGNATKYRGVMGQLLSYVDVLNPDFSLGEDFTVELWVKTPDSAPADIPQRIQTLIGTNTPRANNSALHLYFSDNQGAYAGPTRFQFATVGEDGKVYDLYGTTAIEWGKWYHLAVVRYSGSLRMFVNGKVEGAVTIMPVQAKKIDQRLLFGAFVYNYSWSNFFQGQIDEVRISSTARYSSDFAPPRLPFSNDANTLGLWHFDEPAGSSHVQDASNHNPAGYLGNVDLVVSGIPYTIIPSYRACRNYACAKIEGIGKNSCSYDAQCTFVRNSSFELDLNRDNHPDMWSRGKFLDGEDRVDGNIYLEGKASFKFSPKSPTSTATEAIAQSIAYSGAPDEAVVLDVWNKTNQNLSGGNTGAIMRVYYADGTSDYTVGLFPRTAHEWTKKRLVVVPDEPYTKILVTFYNTNSSANYWLDKVSINLVKSASSKGYRTSSNEVGAKELKQLDAAL